jgi:glutamate carboxypeptidase
MNTAFRLLARIGFGRIVPVRASRRRFVLVGAALLLLSFRPALSAPALSPQEQALVTYVDAHNTQGLALLETVVNINSGTQNLDGVRQVGDIFRREFDALGFKTRWVDGTSWNRAGHLVAEHPGPGPKILLIGHLDTVFPKDSPFQKFRRIDENTATGPGIIDMKGGDVIMVQALKALDSAGLLQPMNISVALMGDEEDPGSPISSARAALKEAAKDAKAAIGFENGDNIPEHIIISRRGIMSWTLTVSSKGGHSGLVGSAEIGYGAIYEASHMLDELRSHLLGEKYLTINPGLFLGGTQLEFPEAASKGSAFGKNNVVAANAMVTGDLRALSPQQFERAMEKMKKLVSRPLPKANATLDFSEGYPAMAPTDGNLKLLRLYDEASRDLGYGPVQATSPDKAGAADVSFVAGIVPMVIDSAGLKGHGEHSVDETANLNTLPEQTQRIAVLLARLPQIASH